MLWCTYTSCEPTTAAAVKALGKYDQLIRDGGGGGLEGSSFNENWPDNMSYEKTTTDVASHKVPYTHMDLMCPTLMLLSTTLYTGGILISNVTGVPLTKLS